MHRKSLLFAFLETSLKPFQLFVVDVSPLLNLFFEFQAREQHQNLGPPRFKFDPGNALNQQENQKPMMPAGGVRENAMGKGKGPTVLISETPECSVDVKRICAEGDWGNNFRTLSCLSLRKDDTDLSDDCHTVYIRTIRKQLSN